MEDIPSDIENSPCAPTPVVQKYFGKKKIPLFVVARVGETVSLGFKLGFPM